MNNETYKILRLLYYGSIIILAAHTFEVVRNMLSFLDMRLLGNLTPMNALALWVVIGTILAYNRQFG